MEELDPNIKRIVHIKTLEYFNIPNIELEGEFRQFLVNRLNLCTVSNEVLFITANNILRYIFKSKFNDIWSNREISENFRIKLNEFNVSNKIWVDRYEYLLVAKILST